MLAGSNCTRPNSPGRVVVLLVLLLLLTAASALRCAAPADKPAGPALLAAAVDPRAEQDVRRMSDLLAGAKAFSLHVEATMDMVVDTGQHAQFTRRSDITVARPDRLHAVTDSTEGSWAIWYKGTSLTILNRRDNTFAVESVPDHMDAMLDFMADQYDLVMPMADLLVGDTNRSLLADVHSGAYLGRAMVGDVSCNHLLFTQENIDWQIWIAAEGLPLPLKMVITRKLEPGQPQYVALISHWNLSPSTSDEMFTFTAPEGAERTTMENLVAGAESESDRGDE